MNYLLMIIPMTLLKCGNFLKNKDTNATGTDDAFGNVLIAVAPAVDAFATGNDKALRKALRAVRQTIDNYLGEEQTGK